MVNINLHIPETQQVPNRINSKKTTVRHILVKILKAKNKEEILKPVREKWVITYKETPVRLIAAFS